MAQTRIDQFYKVTYNSRKSENPKNNIEKSLNFGSFAINEKKGRKLLSRKSKAFPIYGSKVSPCQINEQEVAQNNVLKKYHLSETNKTDMINTATKIMKAKTEISPTTKTSPIRSQQHTPIPHSSSKYALKTLSPIKNSQDKSQKHIKMIRKKLFIDMLDELKFIAIDNLNLAKEGAISDNDINLEKVYFSGVFNYKYNSIDTTVSTKYEINDVIIPTEMYSKHFLLVITTVFSKPINCGYFDKDELDLVFSLLTLSRYAQALLIRMLKRKQTWHRIDNIKYSEISDDLKPIFDELVSRSIFRNNMENEDISVLLNLLQVDEIRKLCQKSKINSNSGKKEDYIQSILKFCKTKKPLFPGMQSPANKLRASINNILGYCVLLNTKVKQIIDRIITLLMPNRDPTESLADTFLMLLRIETDEIKFPEVSVTDFPIFANKGHLLDYIEAKSALSDALNAIEKKQWQIVRNLGFLATQRLSLSVKAGTQSLENSILPDHIKHFMPNYIWLKVLSKSIDAFKKTKETMLQAIEFLHILINQNCHMNNRKGQWYNELIKIEMYHRKNFDTSVTLLSNALSQENLTEVDKLDLLERAEMLAKRKSGISQHAKDTIKLILDNKLKTQLTIETNSITIQGTLCENTLKKKSTWCISSNIDQIYGSVESLALYHYKHNGYPKGVHCESALPVTLFGVLFWHEIYNINIPGTCVSSYQDAPLDLFSSRFYENRKKQIDMKLQNIRNFDSKELSSYVKQKFDLYRGFKSICQSNTFDDSSSLQEIALCLDVKGVVGICERLIHNFPLWKAGFPDLIVWNACTRQYKIVEVKGPGDSLSTKQKLWLEYLNQLGLNTEVCYCKSNIKGSCKRKYEAMI